jgi:DNA-binding transcriptional MerR regulator
LGEDKRGGRAGAGESANVTVLRAARVAPEPERSAAGYRAYTPQVVQIVRFIKRAQDLGFALDDVESLLHLDTRGPETCDAVREMATEKVADLDARIADLQAMRGALARLVETCQRPRARRECPILSEVSGKHEDDRP